MLCDIAEQRLETSVTSVTSVTLEQKRFEIYAYFSHVCKLWLFDFIPQAKIFRNVNIKWSKFVCEKMITDVIIDPGCEANCNRSPGQL